MKETKMDKNQKMLIRCSKTRHMPVAGQLTKSRDKQEFDTPNFNTNYPSNQLNEERPQLPPEAKVPEDHGLDACPWLDEYVEFSRIWSPESFDGYHEACGLAVLSIAAAGRVVFNMSGLRKTNLNILLVGRTSIYAKSTVSKIAKDLLVEAGLDWLLAPDETTPQKLIEDMSSVKLPDNFAMMNDEEQLKTTNRMRMSGQRGWIVDEFGDRISAMMQPDNCMSGIKGLIRTLDGAPLKYEYATIGRGLNLITNPYLPILGNITIADLSPYAKRGNTLWGDGFFARFATPTPPIDSFNSGRFPNKERIFPKSLVSPIVDWNIRLGLPQYKIEGPNGNQILKIKSIPQENLRISDKVSDAFNEYHEGLRWLIWKNENDDLDGNYARLPEKALRIAALFASLANSDSILLKHWAKAQSITERWRVGLHEMYEQLSSGNQDQATKYIKDLPVEDQILRAISKNVMPTKREISQFTGFDYDIVEPGLKKLISDGNVLAIQQGKTTKFYLP